MDGDAGNERVTSQTVMGKSQQVENQGKSPVGMKLVKSVTHLASIWGKVEV